MTTKQLEYFIAVATSLNISKASKELYVSQPFLSRQIKSLEDELQVTLFIRTSRFLQLTNAGQKLLSKANQIINLHHELIDEMQQESKNSRSTIKIGYMPGSFMLEIADIIKSYKDSNPNTHVELASLKSSEIIDDVSKGDLHMGFLLSMGTNDSFDLNHKILYSCPLYAAVLADSPLSKLKSISAEELSKENIIMISKGQVPYQNRDAINPFSMYTSGGSSCIITQDSITSLFLVRAGQGVAVVAKEYVANLDSGLVYIPITDTSPINLVTVWGKKDNALCSPFIDYVKSNLENHYKKSTPNH